MLHEGAETFRDFCQARDDAVVGGSEPAKGAVSSQAELWRRNGGETSSVPAGATTQLQMTDRAGGDCRRSGAGNDRVICPGGRAPAITVAPLG